MSVRTPKQHAPKMPKIKAPKFDAGKTAFNVAAGPMIASLAFPPQNQQSPAEMNNG